jgi:hypothetical protein
MIIDSTREDKRNKIIMPKQTPLRHESNLKPLLQKKNTTPKMTKFPIAKNKS